MSMTEEPYIWLQEGEAKGADATGLVELFADWFSRGPAVFLDPKVMHAVNMHADLVELVYDYQSSSTMTPESHFAELRARAWKLLEKARGKDEPGDDSDVENCWAESDADCDQDEKGRR